MALARESERLRVLSYDALEMDPPAVELTFEQRKLDAALGGLRLRRAIVVPNSRLLPCTARVRRGRVPGLLQSHGGGGEVAEQRIIGHLSRTGSSGPVGEREQACAATRFAPTSG